MREEELEIAIKVKHILLVTWVQLNCIFFYMITSSSLNTTNNGDGFALNLRKLLLNAAHH